MKPEDERWIFLADFVLQQAAMQTAFQKMTMAALTNLQSLNDLRGRIELLPPGPERDAQAAQLARICRQVIGPQILATLSDRLSIGETLHEKLEAVLSDLKKSL